jgi:putative ABC transport system ATP-binding protein
VLERVGLGHRLGHFPRQLSTGQQQRVAVARALANRPRLVLADEPTGNLDARHAGEALALIREVCREQGAALLLVSHDEGVLGQFQLRRDFAELNQAVREDRR